MDRNLSAAGNFRKAMWTDNSDNSDNSGPIRIGNKTQLWDIKYSQSWSFSLIRIISIIRLILISLISLLYNLHYRQSNKWQLLILASGKLVLQRPRHFQKHFKVSLSCSKHLSFELEKSRKSPNLFKTSNAEFQLESRNFLNEKNLNFLDGKIIPINQKI